MWASLLAPFSAARPPSAAAAAAAARESNDDSEAFLLMTTADIAAAGKSMVHAAVKIPTTTADSDASDSDRDVVDEDGEEDRDLECLDESAADSEARYGMVLRIVAVVALFAASLGFLVAAVVTLPPLASGNSLDLEVTSLEDVQDVVVVLREYSAQNALHVVTLLTVLYLFKQVWSIPGAVFLNLIAGALYGPVSGSLLTVLLTATGASGCYLLSSLLGASVVRRRLLRNGRGKFAHLARCVREERQQGSLVYYLLFLRLFPLTPSWALNLAAPFLGIDLWPFFWTALVGLAPYTIVTTQAGALVSELSSIDDLWQPAWLAELAIVAVVALVPVCVKKWTSARSKAAEAAAAPSSASMWPACLAPRRAAGFAKVAVAESDDSDDDSVVALEAVLVPRLVRGRDRTPANDSGYASDASA
ncbi:hypothetical protein AMAG_12985 [Allomyces macrogynus ATCC 38327]|uniref:VTT domain-containing protein n=1 Tax=Allomyces macrogynus (strain ATCC 38327) TaxID=578462 RepID=A0A0L0T0N4_ALLM3|nr:hypothetical protein AMAG_12985 [Allomyces macrogynus ATCC 38327]|eukprot:KNE68321.1 hypothetical protein AMAG_12985 [Allomyces macrogynus ATCC 38327]